MKPQSVYVGDDRVLTRTKNGFKLFVDARDVSIAPHLILEGVWEEWTERVLRSVVKPGMCVVEIGANVGYFTLLMARAVGKAGSVLAFECDPRLARIVRDNIEVNGFSKIAKIDERAVSETSGTVSFFTAEHHRGGGTLVAGLEQIPELTATERREVRVEATTLDHIAAGLDRSIDLIKIDAEGAETAVLRGGATVFGEPKPLTAIIKFCPEFVARSGEEPRALLERFERWGFSIARIDERKRRPVRATIEALVNEPYSELLLCRL